MDVKQCRHQERCRERVTHTLEIHIIFFLGAWAKTSLELAEIKMSIHVYTNDII